jgi:hypothetical protein
MAYEQEFDCVVWRNGEEVERVRANAYVPFTLDSIEGMFFPGTMRVGTLYQKYMPIEPVVPHVPLSWQPPEPAAEEVVETEPELVEEPAESETDEEPANEAELTDAESDTTGTEVAGAETAAPPPPPMPERVELGDLSAGEPLEVEGFTLTLENPYEGSVLTYRHDPGVPLLYIAITLFILGLAIRTYWPSYRVSLWIDEVGGKTVGKLVFRATGMLGEPEVVESQLIGDLGVLLKRTKAQSGEAAQPKQPAEGGATAAATPGKDGPTPTATPGEGGPAPAARPDAPEPGRAPEVKPPAGEPSKPGKYPLRDALPEDDEETPSSS